MRPPIEIENSAQKLARNPLGIIALFLLLVYGIAGLVVGANVLQPSERLPLIWFMVLFPLVVLGAFYRLVTTHHTKLYAPRDYSDSEGFFRALTPAEQRERLRREVHNFELSGASQNEAGHQISALEMESAGFSPTTSYVLAEELAFRELESQLKRNIQRHVELEGVGYADGILKTRTSDRDYAIEVKVLHPAQVVEGVREAAQQIRSFARQLNREWNFILAVVLVRPLGEDAKPLVDDLREELKSGSIPIRLRVFDFENLSKKYGISSSES